MANFSAAFVIAGLLCVLGIGCQSSTAPINSSAASVAPLPSDRVPTADEAVASDVSATRLHDIVGAILNYYIHNQNALPNFLEDVKPFADFGTELNFTSPSSGMPYAYSASGLFIAGQDKRIIVWDPKPNKQGVRWCILMPRMVPGTAIIPEVVAIEEKTFQTFAPGMP